MAEKQQRTKYFPKYIFNFILLNMKINVNVLVYVCVFLINKIVTNYIELYRNISKLQNIFDKVTEESSSKTKKNGAKIKKLFHLFQIIKLKSGA